VNDERSQIPSWLAQSEQYRPGSDRDGFISRSALQVTRAIAQFRLDDGRDTPLSPAAPTKIVFALCTILMVSLSRNHLFVLVVLAGMLVRACLLPQRALARVMSGAAVAALLTGLVMLPAVLVGQPRAAATLATKAFVCAGITLTTALSTPAAKLTHAMRSFGLPSIAIMTIDLALRSIVRLGETATEALAALGLRSVGRNPDKRGAIGGVGGVVLLKAARASQETFDAMR